MTKADWDDCFHCLDTSGSLSLHPPFRVTTLQIHLQNFLHIVLCRGDSSYSSFFGCVVLIQRAAPPRYITSHINFGCIASPSSPYGIVPGSYPVFSNYTSGYHTYRARSYAIGMPKMSLVLSRSIASATTFFSMIPLKNTEKQKRCTGYFYLRISGSPQAG